MSTLYLIAPFPLSYARRAEFTRGKSDIRFMNARGGYCSSSWVVIEESLEKEKREFERDDVVGVGRGELGVVEGADGCCCCWCVIKGGRVTETIESTWPTGLFYFSIHVSRCWGIT